MDLNETTKVIDRIEKLETAKQRLQELEFNYRLVEDSKFAKLRGIVVDVRSLVGRAHKPRSRENVRRELLSTGLGSSAALDADRDALLAELRKVDAERETLLELLSVERLQRESGDAYDRWMRRNAVRDADIPRLRAMSGQLAYRPVFSVIMPTYNTVEEHLRAAIESIATQAYPYWQLCISDDASPDPRVREVILEYAGRDSRISYVFREKNGHISLASNSALEIATGEFVALFDHDDALTADALFEYALLLNEYPDTDMIYSDEDKLGDDGVPRDPFFKPDWSPDSFLSRMYTCHLGVYRASVVHEIGGFRAGFEGSQDYDFVLRFTERTQKIRHIPRILYHWRMHAGSTAGTSAAKPYAYVAGQRALTEALERRGEPGRIVVQDGLPGLYIARYDLIEKRKIAIIVPTRDNGGEVDQLLKSIFKRDSYKNFEITIVDNGSTDGHTVRTLKAWEQREKRVRVLRYDVPFNFSQINNYAVARTDSHFLLFLNDDTEVITDDWLEAMAEQAQRPSIGVVGPLLYHPDETVQHGGVIVGLGGIAAHGHRDVPRTNFGYFGVLRSINNFSAVTAACAMMRRDVFDEVGGFDESLAVAYNDVDLCLKVQAAGYRNVFLPHVELYHLESKSRGSDTTPEKQARLAVESGIFRKRWQAVIDHDPCYNPNLTLGSPTYEIRE